jgi:uncharacterized protein (UPF0264 family)
VNPAKVSEVLTAMQANDNEKGRILPQKEGCGLLVSAQDWDEVRLAIECGVPWLDLKDPGQGALGRPPLPLVESLAHRMGSHTQARWSVAGGELLDWNAVDGQPFLNALGSSGAIKWALAGCNQDPEWVSKVDALAQTIPDRRQVILVHYADCMLCDAPSWTATLAAAKTLRLRYVLCDTALKNGRTLLDYYAVERLQTMVCDARGEGIEVAIAGSLQMNQLALGEQIGAAWIGVRGAVCSGPGRTSPISREKLQHAVAIMQGFGTTKHLG